MSMAHLLGSKYCIESLRNDVTDLQATVVDVFSRAGPVNHPSWKYPDKISSDVNIVELLDIYNYNEEEEEECQVAHIVLLELIVDRLVLLLQAMAKYLEQTLSAGRITSGAGPSSNTSVGLVVKKYWNKLVHIHTVTKQLQSEARTKNRKIADLENTVLKLTEELEDCQNQSAEASLANSGSSASTPFNPDALLPGGLDSTSFASLMSMAKKKKDISTDEYNKASQTIKTAFVPCEGCDRVQKNLRELGRELIIVCRSQGLPSSLEHHMDEVAQLDWLTHHDVSRWVSEQNKDLARIKKHLEYLMSTIQPLKENLAREQDRNQVLQEKVATLEKELSLERQTQTIQLSQYENKLKEARERNSEQVVKIQRHLDDMSSTKNDLDKQLNALRHEHSRQQALFRDLEKAKAKTEEELEENQTNKTELRHLEGDLEDLRGQLETSRDKLSEVQRELSKEKLKNRSASRHTESLQGKQGSLLQRIDALDIENEELRGQVAELQEDKERSESTLERSKDECREYDIQLREFKKIIKDLSNERTSLESMVRDLEDKTLNLESKLQEAKEQLHLTIEYPDLNGPVNKDLVGTGDIAVDMENQVKANSLRIHVLEEQNATLRKTITKMLRAQGSPNDTEEHGPAPVPLWRPTDAVFDNNMDGDHGSKDLAYNSKNHDRTNFDLPPRPPNAKAKSAPPHQRAPRDQADDEELFIHRSKPDQHAIEKLFHRRTPSEKNNSPSRGENKKGNQGAREWVPPETFVVRKAPKPKGQVKSGVKSRPVSAKAALESGDPSQVSASSISAYIQLKKSGLLKMPSGGKSRPVSAVHRAPSSALGEYYGVDTVSCDKCDKMYSSKKDLDVHRLYCFGGI